MARKRFALDGTNSLRSWIYQEKTKRSVAPIVAADFFIHHIWVGMMVREHCHAFSRKVKAMLAFSIMVVSGFILMLRLGVAQIDNHAVLDYGNVRYDWIFLDCFAALGTACIIVYPIMYIMK